MRGRTLNNAFIVLDEAQNTTPEQMKMFLTRLGFGSRMVVTGDITQVDLPTGASGLQLVTRVLDDIDDIHFARLTSEDVVRHTLVGRIVDAYTKYDAEKQAQKFARENGFPSVERANREERRRGCRARRAIARPVARDPKQEDAEHDDRDQQRVGHRRRRDGDCSASPCTPSTSCTCTRDAELAIVLVDEAAMEQLHVQWMDEPGPTDVLSFPMDELRPGVGFVVAPGAQLVHRKAQNVGGAGLVHPLHVQLLDRGLVNEHDRELGVAVHVEVVEGVQGQPL